MSAVLQATITLFINITLFLITEREVIKDLGLVLTE